MFANIRKKLNLYYMLILLYQTEVVAKSLDSAASSFLSKVSKLGNIVAVIGFVIAGLYLSLGKEEGRQKVAMAVSGASLILLAPAIFNWLRSIF